MPDIALHLVEGVPQLAESGNILITRSDNTDPEECDVADLITKVGSVSAERNELRTKLEGAQANLAPWEGIGKTAEEVTAAFEKLGQIDEGTLEQADAVAEKIQAAREDERGLSKKQLEERDATITALTAEAFAKDVREILTTSPSRKLFHESVQHPDELMPIVGKQARPNENGQAGVHFLGWDGKRILSEKPGHAGENADHDESLAKLLATHPRRLKLTAPDVGSGSGSEDGTETQQGRFTLSKSERQSGKITKAQVRAKEEAAEKAGQKLVWTE